MLILVEEIAVVTASGKAYYRLVNELKKRRIKFLSLKPEEPVPSYIKVVVTTESPPKFLNCEKTIIYDEKDDPAYIIGDSLRILQGKSQYDTLIIGVDPGKRFGIAIIGDGAVIKTGNYLNVEKTTSVITKALREIKACEKVVKIGDGAKVYGQRLVKSLDKTIPSDIALECVKENGTTKPNYTRLKRRRGLRDEIAALRISSREGQTIRREKHV